jgi:hypothetical protein
MTMHPPLTGAHRRTYRSIFEHPVWHNLSWHEVHALFRHLGLIQTLPDGSLKVTRHGQTLILHPPRSPDFASTDDLATLRDFLVRSEADPADRNVATVHWLLVIDQREARVYRAELQAGSACSPPPHAPGNHLLTPLSLSDHDAPANETDPDNFFSRVARALDDTGPVLVFGTGPGMNREINSFMAWVVMHEPALARRIIGSVTVDEPRLSEDQLLIKARAFYPGSPGHLSMNTMSARGT